MYTLSKSCFKLVVRKHIDFLIYLLKLIRKLVNPSKKDPVHIPNMEILSEYIFLPGDLVTTEDKLELMQDGLLMDDPNSLTDNSDSYLVGSVVGYSYPTDDTIVVAYFNMLEFDKPILRTHNKKSLILMNSPTQTMVMAHTLTQALESGELGSISDIEDLLSSKDDDDDPDPEDGSGGNDDGVICH